MLWGGELGRELTRRCSLAGKAGLYQAGESGRASLTRSASEGESCDTAPWLALRVSGGEADLGGGGAGAGTNLAEKEPQRLEEMPVRDLLIPNALEAKTKGKN